jgi:hypothetical protein
MVPGPASRGPAAACAAAGVPGKAEAASRVWYAARPLAAGCPLNRIPVDLRRSEPWLALAISAAFILPVAWGLSVHSGAVDELGAHVPAGILAWKSGHPGSGFANPPLGQMLVAAGPVLAGTADDPLADEPHDLLPARAPVVLMGLALVAAIGRAGALAFGRGAGWAAAGAAALSPDLVAHAGLATLDLPVAAFTTFACLLAWRWMRTGAYSDLVAFAIAAGTACMIKSTALLYLAAIPLGAAALPLPPAARLRRAGGLALAGAAAAVVLAWLSYGPGPARGILPAAWVDSVLSKLAQAGHGHFAYLAGRRSAAGFPEYLAVALALKTPLALQLCGVAGAWALVRRRPAPDAAGFVALMLVPALLLLVWMSLVQRVHIGVRHVLPAIPALLVLAGAGWMVLLRGGAAGRLAAAALATWALVAQVRATPDQLSYFHELAGGTARGDRWLIDSNLDWGQDEGRFRAWARGRDVIVNPDRPAAGLVAANVNALHGILSSDDLRLRWLRRFEPVRTFGGSWRVFEVTEEPLREAAARDPAAALDYAWWLVGVGRAGEARAILAEDRMQRLERDPVLARQLWRVRGEAAIDAGDSAAALAAAERADDEDLAAEAAHRLREARGETAGPAEAARAVRALAKRGHREEASALGVETFGKDPLEVPPAGVPARWTEARRLKQLGLEREALSVVARVLAADPRNDDALWLYGELVVRRKLGLAEYPWPDVDWSGISRAAASSGSPAGGTGSSAARRRSS